MIDYIYRNKRLMVRNFTVCENPQDLHIHPLHLPCGFAML